MGGAAAEVAPAPGLHTPGGEPGAAALEPYLLRVLIPKLPSTGSTHCSVPVLFSPSISTTDHTLILLHLFLDLHLILLHIIDSDLGPGVQEGVHHPGLPQPLDPAAGTRGEGCGPLPGHRARASLGHGIRSPWPCHHPRPHLEAGHGEVGLLGHGVCQELGAGLTHPQPGHTLARAAHHALGPALLLGRNTLLRGQSQGDCFKHQQESQALLMPHLLCPLLGQEEPLVPAPPAEHVTVGHVLALLAPGRGVVERGVPVPEAGLQQAVPVLLLHTTQQLNSWSCYHPPTNLA